MKKGMVSIVIPVVRNDPHIAECVDKISNSTYKDVEVLVVDEGLERSAQRNIGIRRAKGEYLLILDSDMMITPYVIEDCVRRCETIYQDEEGNPFTIDSIYIPERIVTKGWFGKLRDWERQFYNGTLIDVVRFVRSSVCPFFDEEMHGVEDSDWERRIIGKKATCSFPVNHHDKCGIIKFLKKKAYYAKCLNVYERKNPNDRLLTFRYRCVQVFIENGKWKRLISKPHYALGVFFLLLARGIIFHVQKRRYK